MADNDEIPTEADIRAKHAARRRAFLQKAAQTAPAVGLLLAQGALPSKASAYGAMTTPGK